MTSTQAEVARRIRAAFHTFNEQPTVEHWRAATELVFAHREVDEEGRFLEAVIVAAGQVASRFVEADRKRLEALLAVLDAEPVTPRSARLASLLSHLLGRASDVAA